MEPAFTTATAVRTFAITASALALAACGRFGFDASDRSSPDAADGVPDGARDGTATGHDEDVDGLPDADDPCPFLPGDAADGDGDGVGDACDPHPGIPGDHVSVFATLQPGDSPFDDISQWNQEPDGIRFSGMTGPLTLTHAFGNARLEVGFVIHGLIGSGQHQIASGIPGSDPYYFVELNENVTVKYFGVIAYDQATGYQSLDETSIPGVHAGTGALRYDIGAQWFAHGGWTNEMYDATALTPAYAGGAGANLVVNGLDVTLTYLAIIDSP